MTITMIEELKRLEAEATPGDWDVSGLTVYDTCMDSVASTHSAADAALIVAMRNALPELLKALEWQPIETAPKGEGWVMLHYRDECVPIISFFSDGAWAHQETMGRNKPTHWMPLPLPPHGGVDVG